MQLSGITGKNDRKYHRVSVVVGAGFRAKREKEWLLKLYN